MNLFTFIDEIARKQTLRALRQIKRGIVKDHKQSKIVALIPENQGQSEIPVEFLTDGDKGIMFIPKNGARLMIGEPQRKRTRKIVGVYPPDVNKDDHVAKEIKDTEVVIFSKGNTLSISEDGVTVATKDVIITVSGSSVTLTANTQNGVIKLNAPTGLINLNAPNNDVTVVGTQGSYPVAAKLKDLDDRITALEKG